MKATASLRVKKFIAARFTPEGAFGLHLSVGVLLLVAATLIFGNIAEAVVGGENITVLDLQLAQWLHAHASSGLTRAMLIVTHMHGIMGMTVAGSLLAGYFYVKKMPYWLLTLAVALPGGMLINALLKYVFARARPTFTDPLLTLSSYSFPSGHTAAATLFYGILAAYLLCRMPKWGPRILIVAGAMLLVALVGLSRMYLGVHYLSDVLAAMAESCAWLAICITASSTWRRRGVQPTSKGSAS